MPKPKLQEKKVNQIPNLKEYLDTYPAVTLQAALNNLEFGDGWNLFRAYSQYIQRRYEVDALDLIPKQDMIQAAAYASGYAKACSDMAESFILGLRETILGKTSYENPRPEE